MASGKYEKKSLTSFLNQALDQGKLTLSIDALLELDQQSDKLYPAIIEFLNEYRVKSLVVQQADKIPLQCRHFLEDLAFVENFNVDTEDDSFKALLTQVSTRNQLFIQDLELRIDPKQPLWEQYFKSQLGASPLQEDPEVWRCYFTQMDVSISLITSCLFPKEKLEVISKKVTYIGKRLFVEQLNFLSSLANPKSFPYSTFYIWTGEVKTAKHVEEILDQLLDHVRKNKYLPFLHLQMSFEQLSPSAFSKFAQLLIHLGENYPHIQSIRGDLSFDTEQLTELNKLASQHQLRILLQLSVGSEQKDHDEYLAQCNQLTHFLINNQRQDNYQRFKQNKPLSLTENQQYHSILNKRNKKGKVPLRACKLSHFNVRGAIGLDVSVDTEHQIQQQVEMQLETQVSSQVQLQNEAFILKNEELLIGKQEYIERHQGAGKGSHRGYRVKEQGMHPLTAARTANPDLLFNKDVNMEAHVTLFCAMWSPLNRNLLFSGHQSEIFRVELSGVFSNMWDSFFGFYGFPQSIKYITPAAEAQIDRSAMEYLNAFHRDELDPGFFIGKSADPNKPGNVLCFDPTKVSNHSKCSPLIGKKKAVSARARRPINYYTPLVQTMLVNDNRIVASGNLEDAMSFYVQFYCSEDSAALGKVSDLIHSRREELRRNRDVDSLNEISWHLVDFLSPEELYEHLKHFITQFSDSKHTLDKLSKYRKQSVKGTNHREVHQKSAEVFFLIEVLYSLGLEGLNDFLSALTDLEKLPDRYKHFRMLVCCLDKDHDNIRFRETINPAHLDLIKRLILWNDNEFQWWQTILACRQLYGFPFEEETQLKGFQFFLEQLKLHRLPPTCPLASPNPLAELHRLQFIFSKVKPKNLDDQLCHLNNLNLGPDGAWYAVFSCGFHYVHEKMCLEPQYLHKEDGEATYHVSFDTLKNFAGNNTFDGNNSFEMIFYRFIGCQEEIITPFDSYIQLVYQVNSLDLPRMSRHHLLILLALASTGRGASQELNISLLIASFKAQPPKKISEILVLLLQYVGQMVEQKGVIPNLQELDGLFRFAFELSDPSKQLQTLFKNSPSEKLLQSFALHAQNKEHISVDFFVQAHAELIKKNLSERWLWILASVKKDNTTTLASFLSLAAKEQAESKHSESKENGTTLESKLFIRNLMEESFANIDLNKTDSQYLPTLPHIANFLNSEALKQCKTPEEALKHLKSCFPQCVFHAKRTIFLSNPPESSLSILDKELKQLFSLTEDDMSSDKRLLLAIERQVSKISPEQVARAKEMVRKRIFYSLSQYSAQFPELDSLQIIYPGPELTLDYPSMSMLYLHCKQLEKLFNIFLEMKNKWGGNFTINPILNFIPLTTQLNTNDLIVIFEAIQQQNYKFNPKALIDAIFAESKQAISVNFSKEMSLLINSKNLLFLQKIALIDTLKENPGYPNRLNLLDSLIRGLETTKARHAKEEFDQIAPGLFKLWLHCLNLEDRNLIEATQDLLLIPNVEIEVKKQILACFSRKDARLLSDYHVLLDRAKNIKDVNSIAAFFKIVAYGVLKQDYNPKHLDNDLFIENGLIAQLAALSPSKIEGLMAFYQQPPRPNLTFLKQFLASGHLIAQDVYEKDPSGERTIPGEFDKQFSLENIDKKIDEFFDQTTKKKLPYDHRRRLYEDIAYVYQVGKKQNLTIPGDENNQFLSYKKPVCELSREAIKRLAIHYRTFLYDKKTQSPEYASSRRLAKLEYAALMREALYRVKLTKDSEGRMTGGIPSEFQILALIESMQHDKNNLIFEMGTGTGKSSHVDPLLLAYLLTITKSACVIDGNVARRDMDQNKDFYDYLGIPVALIQSDSPNEVYQREGINYSDATELPLWIKGQMLKGDWVPDEASVLVSEIDAFALDQKQQFRLSLPPSNAQGPYSNPYAHLYTHVLDFVQSELFLVCCEPEEDVDNLINSLPDFIKPEFRQFSTETLSIWLDSAYAATRLREKEDYTIVTKTIEHESHTIISQAVVKMEDNPQPNSRFSKGIHQFLHVLLEERRDEKDPPFLIEPEQYYLASSSAKNILDFFMRGPNNKARGVIWGTTATPGNNDEQHELSRHYGMRVVKVPESEQSKLAILDPVVAKKARDPEQNQFIKILEDIKEARQRNQCILIICQSVKYSERLHDFLSRHLPADFLQLHNGEQRNQTDDSVTQRAGQTGMATIATGRYGRATDIKPIHQAGLHVITTHIAEERKAIQYRGRGARNKACGSSRLILSSTEFTDRGKPIPKNLEELERSIAIIQKELSKQKAEERIEDQLFSDIREQLIQQYIDLNTHVEKTLKKHCGKDFNFPGLWEKLSLHLTHEWTHALTGLDNKWNELRTELYNEYNELHQKISAKKMIPIQKEAELEKEKEALLTKKMEELALYTQHRWTLFANQIIRHSQIIYTQHCQNYLEMKKDREESKEEEVKEEKSEIIPLIFSFNTDVKFKPKFEDKPYFHHASLEELRKWNNMKDWEKCRDTPLVPSDHSEIYTQLADEKASDMRQHQEQEQKKQWFQTQLKHLHLRMVEDEKAKKGDKKQSEPNLKGIAELLLQNYAQKTKLGLNASFYFHLFLDLVDMVKSVPELAYIGTLQEVFHAHLAQIKNEPHWLKKDEYLFQINKLRDKLDISTQKEEVDSPNSWDIIYKFARKRIENDYLAPRLIYWRASDRIGVAKQLLIQLDDINKQHKKSAQAKLRVFHSVLLAQTQLITKSDRSQFFKRNQSNTGSRLQKIVDEVTQLVVRLEKKTAPKQAEEVKTESKFTVLNKLVFSLIEESRQHQPFIFEPNYSKVLNEDQKQSESTMSSNTDTEEKAAIIHDKKTLDSISNQLENYRCKFFRTPENTPRNQKSFVHRLNTTITHLQAVIADEEATHPKTMSG